MNPVGWQRPGTLPLCHIQAEKYDKSDSDAVEQKMSLGDSTVVMAIHN
jgi:hypothetical protein